MPRQARVIVSGLPHHIVQRGHNKQPVFLENHDFQYYLANLREWKNALGLEVFSYCLMTNHVHLIVQAGEELGAIPQLMKRLAGRQTPFTHCDWLDEPPTRTELESDASSRRERYRAFVGDGELSHQGHLIRAAIDRNKLTGGNRFVDEVERHIGLRIESRAPGRPRI